MFDENLLTEDIPEKFKDPKTGAIRANDLVKSYKELEKKMSSQHGVKPPENPQDYDVSCDHGFFEPDMSVNEKLHKLGLSNEQVQGVYDLAADKMVPMIVEMASEFEAEREVERLIKHFGSAEIWAQVSKQLLAFGRKNLPADVLDSLASSYEGVLALERMMKGEEPSLVTTDVKTEGSIEDKELQSMMRDPKYWRDRDPAFVAKVTEGFQSLYGSK